MDVDQSLMAKINDQNENGMHWKTISTIPNCQKSQIKHAVHNIASSSRNHVLAVNGVVELQ
jgi:hypothetical protein